MSAYMAVKLKCRKIEIERFAVVEFGMNKINGDVGLQTVSMFGVSSLKMIEK